MIDEKKVLIALGALNESKVIGKVIEGIKKEGYDEVLVVDDGSEDDTGKVAKDAGAIVIKHVINRGQGVAASTALEYAKEHDYEYIVFMDSDGQHDPKDITKLLKEAEEYDIVIGSRMIYNKGMPFYKKILNLIGSFITWIFFHVYVKDSQTGFKIFNRKVIEKISFSYDRYEWCSEVMGEIHKHNFSFIEIPIKVIYTDYSRSKEVKQGLINGIKMVLKFFYRKIFK